MNVKITTIEDLCRHYNADYYYKSHVGRIGVPYKTSILWHTFKAGGFVEVSASRGTKKKFEHFKTFLKKPETRQPSFFEKVLAKIRKAFFRPAA